MFSVRLNQWSKVKKSIICGILGLSLFGVGFFGILGIGSRETAAIDPASLIRFHVIANSDSQEDQLLKYAVRDEILKQVAPRLAQSSSLEESRAILNEMQGELVAIANRVVRSWGKDYPVTYFYGRDTFPTKSYGNIVLPAGEYEAVKIKIGKAAGANWWCVLFPPLCFVNVQESTALPVDGKAAVPLDTAQKEHEKAGEANSAGKKEPTVLTTYKGKKVEFFFERFFR
jgi:stage II sporulation protein R